LFVPEFLNTIEQTSLSTWLRESYSIFGFYFVLCVHTIGLSLVVGANSVVDLRLLGVASDLPLKPLKQLFRVMWIGFALNATSGVFLLIAYPTKSLTNPVFYVKLSLIALAILTMQKIKNEVFGDDGMSEAAMMAKGKTLAKVSLFLWIGAITAGRLLAYTYLYIMFGHEGAG
jgi:hypothetical protein